MPLPKIDIATFELKLPSDGRKLKYRPFLVKEEKILLIAAESKNNDQILNAIEQVITNCVTESIDLDQMPSFDVEYIFLKLREKSIGDVIKVTVTDPEVKKKFEVNVDLNKVTIKKSNKHEKKVQLSDSLFLQMKYPNLKTILSLDDSKTMVENGLEVITNCIEKIYDQETVYDPKEYTKKELHEFLENLTQDMFEKINQFFETMPTIYYESEETSPFSDKKIKVVLDKFIDFFD